jgi:hypothetical protein
MEDCMFTKKDFAHYLIEKTAESEGVTEEDVKKNPDIYTYKSTSCGLALQYLGLLNEDKELNSYLESRGGTFLTYFYKPDSVNNKFIGKYLSVEEMFDLLPEEIKTVKKDMSISPEREHA